MTEKRRRKIMRERMEDYAAIPENQDEVLALKLREMKVPGDGYNPHELADAIQTMNITYGYLD